MYFYQLTYTFSKHFWGVSIEKRQYVSKNQEIRGIYASFFQTITSAINFQPARKMPICRFRTYVYTRTLLGNRNCFFEFENILPKLRIYLLIFDFNIIGRSLDKYKNLVIFLLSLLYNVKQVPLLKSRIGIAMKITKFIIRSFFSTSAHVYVLDISKVLHF